MEFVLSYLTPEDLSDLKDLSDLVRLGSRLAELSWGTRMVAASALFLVAFVAALVIRVSKKERSSLESVIHQAIFWGLGLGLGSVWFLAFAVVVAMKKKKFLLGVVGAVALVFVFQMELAMSWWKGSEASSGLIAIAINTVSALFC